MVTVRTDEICAAIKLGFNDTRTGVALVLVFFGVVIAIPEYFAVVILLSYRALTTPCYS
jgi:hypothetical protein